MAKTCAWNEVAATATSAGKHDVIVEMTDTAPMTRREEERRMDLRIHLSEKRRKGREGGRGSDVLGSLVLLRYLVATATAAGNQCGSSAAKMESSCRRKKYIQGFMSNCQAK